LERIIINTPGSHSEILVGEKLKSVSHYLPDKGVVIVTDENVLKLYGDSFPPFPVFTIAPGEESKRLEVIGDLTQKLLDAGVDRSGFILAIGGGVVCDVAGFLASVFMRGIGCGYVSTTLLSQVDASTGGKTGVNLGQIKNIIGVIRQPGFVICDPVMLNTLSEEEYLSGLAELIKTAIIGDSVLFRQIEENHKLIIARDTELMTVLVAESVRFKGLVVSEDEKESGIRRVLNFGHTFGHAIELNAKLRHGYAIAAGMKIATAFSLGRHYIDASEAERIISLLRLFNLDPSYSVSLKEMSDILVHDKKKSGSNIHFIFTHGIGKAEVEKVPVNELLDFYKSFIENKVSV
jgi:3-dehydroquinate synthase